MGISSLDLNLLVALRALLEERNVTRAGARVGLSQPAMSAALARLRRHVGDQLLVRVGNHYELTSLGAALTEPVAAAEASVERVFAAQPGFQPATSDREFTVLTSDYALTVLAHDLSTVVRTAAPNIRLNFHPVTPEAVDDSVHALRTVDAMLLPRGFLRDLPGIDLYRDRWVCVAWSGNERIGAELTMAHLVELPWVVTYRRPRAFTHAILQLDALGVEPRVEVVVENFMALPPLVVGTDRVALMQFRLADWFARFTELRILPCPYDALPIVEAMWWHPMHQRDQGHAWLRSTFAEAGRRVS
jgi:DNA-binding transcriptional LysR family regulator